MTHRCAHEEDLSLFENLSSHSACCLFKSLTSLLIILSCILSPNNRPHSGRHLESWTPSPISPSSAAFPLSPSVLPLSPYHSVFPAPLIIYQTVGPQTTSKTSHSLTQMLILSMSLSIAELEWTRD